MLIRIEQLVVAGLLLNCGNESLGVDPKALKRQYGDSVSLQLQLAHAVDIITLEGHPVVVPVVVMADFMRHEGRELVRVQEIQGTRGYQDHSAVIKPSEGEVQVNHLDRNRAAAGTVIEDAFSRCNLRALFGGWTHFSMSREGGKDFHSLLGGQRHRTEMLQECVDRLVAVPLEFVQDHVARRLCVKIGSCRQQRHQ